MKNLSIKIKITLWYTVFMTILILLVLWVLFSVSNSRISSDTQQHLKNTVHKSFGEIEYEDGYLDFDDDLEDLGEWVYLSFYDMQGNMLYGRNPANIGNVPVLMMDTLQQIHSKDTAWYVYDYCQSIEGYGSIWGRGIVSLTQADTALRAIARLALVFLPFFVLCTALGGYYIISKTLSPLAAMNDTAQRIGNGSDLTQRIRLGAGGDEVHQLAHTFDHMMDKLQTSFENEKQFTSDVSHELRTPVTVILSQCEYASQPETPAQELKSSISIIMIQARKMSSLISQLLTLARTDSGRQKLHLELLNISELAEIIVEEQKNIASGKSITLETAIQPELYLRADETMMMRLFINLISNSITYGKPNGRTLVTLSGNETEVSCSIEDNGIGIPSNELENIWKRFYQIDPSRSSGENGSGLGLPMVKWIVEAHGGKISAASEYGQGSCFTFILPKNSGL